MMSYCTNLCVFDLKVDDDSGGETNIAAMVNEILEESRTYVMAEKLQTKERTRPLLIYSIRLS